MDLFYLTLAYLGLVPLFVGILLFGESPIFRRTPVSFTHWLITDAIWTALEWLLIKVCGRRGQRLLESALTCLCDKPHPLLQISYLLILVFCYYLYAAHVFVLLPNAWVSEIHIPLSILAMGAAITSFIVASRSDPGIITEATLPAHQALYAFDGLLWKPKQCGTCEWNRPARSKHCRVCGYCIARSDHHCGWINNCVGLYNHRLFLLFLVSNLGLAIYGAVVGVYVLLGEADRAGVLRHKALDYTTGHAKLVYLPAKHVMRWLLVWFSLPTAITMFMAAASLLLLLFIAYQAYLVSAGKTQYEVYRWRDVQATLRLEAAVENSDTDEDNPDKSTQTEQLVQLNKRKGAAGASRGSVQGGASAAHSIKPGIQAYNRGLLQNWSEVLFPFYHLRKAARSY